MSLDLSLPNTTSVIRLASLSRLVVFLLQVTINLNYFKRHKWINKSVKPCTPGELKA